MKTKLVLLSDTRSTARLAVEKIISDHVWGSPQALQREDLLELRAVFRAKSPFGQDPTSWERKVYHEEIAIALGRRTERRHTRKRVVGYTEADIMPSMREWARQVGILATQTP